MIVVFFTQGYLYHIHNLASFEGQRKLWPGSSPWNKVISSLWYDRLSSWPVWDCPQFGRWFRVQLQSNWVPCQTWALQRAFRFIVYGNDGVDHGRCQETMTNNQSQPMNCMKARVRWVGSSSCNNHKNQRGSGLHWGSLHVAVSQGIGAKALIKKWWVLLTTVPFTNQ